MDLLFFIKNIVISIYYKSNQSIEYLFITRKIDTKNGKKTG